MWKLLLGPDFGSISELASAIGKASSQNTGIRGNADANALGAFLAVEPWAAPVDSPMGPQATVSSPAAGPSCQTTTLAAPIGSTLVGSAGGLQFKLNWDSSVSSAPAAFKTAAITAATYFTQMYSNAEVININIGYGEVNGVPLPAGTISDSIRPGTDKSYSSVLTALNRDAGNSALQAQADAGLPSADPLGSGKLGFGGQPLPDYYVPYAEQKALGMLSPSGSEIDGYIGMSSTLPMDYAPPTGAGQYDAVGSFEHEISEVMGRFGSVGAVYGSGIYTPMDLFRYASSGVRDKTGAASAAYFSADAGATNLAPYDTKGADAADWSSLIHGDAFGYGASGVTDTVSPVDLASLAVVGYNLTPAGLTAIQHLTPLV